MAKLLNLVSRGSWRIAEQCLDTIRQEIKSVGLVRHSIRLSYNEEEYAKGDEFGGAPTRIGAWLSPHLVSQLRVDRGSRNDSHMRGECNSFQLLLESMWLGSSTSKRASGVHQTRCFANNPLMLPARL